MRGKKLLAWLNFFLLVSPLLVWANGGEEEEKLGFGLISGLLLLFFLLGTAGAGFAMLKGKVSRRVHHFLAYITLFLAIIHALYNTIFH